MSKKTIAAICLIGSAILAATHDFIPDVTFKGSSLAGWHTVGAADWRAENGEIVAKPKQESGGWLVLDKGYQDLQFYASFRCTGPCKAGVLLRTQKTADGGLKGTYVSLSEGDVGYYDLVVNSEGKEVSRKKLGPAPGPMIRVAAAPSTAGQEAVPGFSKLASTPEQREKEEEARAAKVAAPAAPAAARAGRGGRGGPSPHADDWNSVQIILDADLIGATLNSGRGGANGVTSDQMMAYGPLALWAGGTGEVRFKDIAYKDLNPKFEPEEKGLAALPHAAHQRLLLRLVCGRRGHQSRWDSGHRCGTVLLSGTSLYGAA